MDWIHCNSCYSQPHNLNPEYTEREFMLTNCGHTFCAVCFPSVWIGPSNQQQSSAQMLIKCGVCGSICHAIKLAPPMKPELEVFFQPFDDHVQKVIRQILQIQKFQQGHRRKLAEWSKKTMADKEAENQTLKATLEEQNNENIQLKKELHHLKSIVSHSSYAFAINRNQQEQQNTPKRPAYFKIPMSTSNAPPNRNFVGAGYAPQHSSKSKQLKSKLAEHCTAPSSVAYSMPEAAKNQHRDKVRQSMDNIPLQLFNQPTVGQGRMYSSTMDLTGSLQMTPKRKQIGLPKDFPMNSSLGTNYWPVK